MPMPMMSMRDEEEKGVEQELSGWRVDCSDINCCT